jgi:hypothetical protein
MRRPCLETPNLNSSHAADWEGMRSITSQADSIRQSLLPAIRSLSRVALELGASGLHQAMLEHMQSCCIPKTERLAPVEARDSRVRTEARQTRPVTRSSCQAASGSMYVPSPCTDSFDNRLLDDTSQPRPGRRQAKPRSEQQRHRRNRLSLDSCPKSKKEESWEVDRILKKRLGPEGRVEYKVRWKGFVKEADSWLPAENFDQNPECMYMAEAKRQRRSKLVRGINPQFDSRTDRAGQLECGPELISLSTVPHSTCGVTHESPSESPSSWPCLNREMCEESTKAPVKADSMSMHSCSESTKETCGCCRNHSCSGHVCHVCGVDVGDMSLQGIGILNLSGGSEVSRTEDHGAVPNRGPDDILTPDL